MADPLEQTVGQSNTLPEHLSYVGFWLRLWASLLDTILVMMLVLPVIQLGSNQEYMFLRLAAQTQEHLADRFFENPWRFFIRGPLDFLVSWVFPAIAVITFWICRSATPGKMAIGAKIVDAIHFTEPSVGQLVKRYFAYYLSMLPIILPLGLIWIAFDPRKQGWHDKLARTVVVRETSKEKK